MREILFRGKTREGKWNESSTVFIRGELALMLTERPIKQLVKDKNGELVDVIFNFCAVEKETVGQFTGLTDKNGEKIFEGDIVQFGAKSRYDGIYKVVFETRGGSGYFGIVINKVETWGFDLTVASKCMEIIGNIHDNPELLEGE